MNLTGKGVHKMSYGVWKKNNKKEGWSSIEIDTPTGSGVVSDMRYRGEKVGWTESESGTSDRRQWSSLKGRIKKYKKTAQRLERQGHRCPDHRYIDDRDVEELKWDMSQSESHPDRYHGSHSFGGGEHHTWFSYDNVFSLVCLLNVHAYDGEEEKEVFYKTLKENHSAPDEVDLQIRRRNMDNSWWSWDKRHELLRVDVNDIDGRYYITAQCVNVIHQFDISSDPNITSEERLDAHVRNAEDRAIDDFRFSLWANAQKKMKEKCNPSMCVPSMLSEEEVKTRIEATLKKQEA